jgi:hypothetical protein
VQRKPIVSSTRRPVRRAGPAALLCVFVVASGCECDEPLATLVPDIVVSPAELPWGTVVVGLGSVEQVQIGNRGTGALSLVSVTVQPDDAGFAVLAAPRRVQPQRAETVDVELSPPFAGTYDAELVIQSDDPDTPEVRVPLTGEGGVGHLVVTPDPLDFGIVHEGPGATRTLTLHNDGFDFLSVTDATFVDVVGFSVDTATLPASLGPGESTTLSVSLLPDAAMLAGLDVPALVDTLRIDATTGVRDVTVSARVNLAPVARAVERDSRLTTVKVGAGTPVFVDGSETVDPEGDVFAFQWSVAERPPGSIAAILGQGQPMVRTTPDLVGRYVVRLRATDVFGAFREADVTILPRDLAVVLTWAASAEAACRAYSDDDCAAMDADERAQRCCGQSDLDLHFIGPGGALGDYGACGPTAASAAAGGTCADVAFCAEESDDHVDTCRSEGLDCAFANRSPDWGSVDGVRNGRADDPRLDIDDVRGAGPEIVSLNTPPDGTYRVVVHYCLDRIAEPTEATVQIFDQGNPIATTQPERLDEGNAWVAAVLVRTGGQWNVVTQPGIFENDVPADLCSR